MSLASGVGRAKRKRSSSKRQASGAWHPARRANVAAAAAMSGERASRRKARSGARRRRSQQKARSSNTAAQASASGNAKSAGAAAGGGEAGSMIPARSLCGSGMVREGGQQVIHLAADADVPDAGASEAFRALFQLLSQMLGMGGLTGIEPTHALP